MIESRWRIASREVIQEVIAANPNADEKALKKAISAAYPFGERAMLPYKMWLDEVKRALGHKKTPPSAARTNREIEETIGNLFEGG